MRFIKETAIFAKSGTLKRFQALETSFKIEQGKISSLISESELIELNNGNKTMYSRLASAEQTVSGLNKLYTDISSKYDSVSGQYTDLNSKIAEYKESVDGFSANLTNLSEHIRDDYSTTQSMEAYVKAAIDGLESTVSQTYVTTGVYTNGIEDAKKYADNQSSGALNSAKSYADDQASAALGTAKTYADGQASAALEDAKKDAASKASNALDDAKADVTERLKKYSTTEQMTSAINQKADEITLSVSKSYVTTIAYGDGIEDVKKYADSQSSGALNSAKSYADGQASETLNNAKAYAENQASDALKDAQADATEKADKALKDAKADMAERLKGYSTTEQMKAAISTAADQIRLEVQGSIYDDYCTNGSFETNADGWTAYTGKPSRTTYLGRSCACLVSGSIWMQYSYTIDSSMKNTITFEAASENKVALNVKVDGIIVKAISSGNMTEKWTEYTVDVELKKGSHTIQFATSTGAKAVYITNVRIRRNNVEWTQSQISILQDSIESKVEKNGIVSAINQTAEKVQIDAARINLNGLVTANENFKILTDGSIEANAGKIAGWEIDGDALKSGGVLITPDYASDEDKIFNTGDTMIFGNYIYVEEMECDTIYSNNYATIAGKGQSVKFDVLRSTSGAKITLTFSGGILVSTK